ncbi:hypothetical protein MJG53_004731 [Ovis ammon polii x Ovis aries]|uniref:Uncharacterized protein n=1 Tax=Ovis ammon polii x Ovis aries TaxID=2918886 RepID=A0ACB9VBL5_9CETA|nr:hypothetical protein MJG53_004731 [Ovis ammon polii x Ovis aries]
MTRPVKAWEGSSKTRAVSHSFSAFPLNEEDGASFFEGRNRVSELLNSGFTEVLLPESGDTCCLLFGIPVLNVLRAQMVGFKRAYPGVGEAEPFLSVEKTPRGDTSNVLNSGENHWINVILISRAMFIRPHFPADSLEAEGELPAWPGLWMLNDASGRGGEGCLMGSDVRSQTHPSGPGVNLSEDNFDLKYEKLDMHT